MQRQPSPVFSFEDMIISLRSAIATFPDKRTGKNTTYTMNDLLVALDGTWYFSSPTIHSPQCSTKRKNGTMLYYHGMINPAIVAPGKRQAITFPAEFILPQDGVKKQDGENTAAKRWITRHADHYAPLSVTFLGDDLYCHQPMIETISLTMFERWRSLSVSKVSTACFPL